jgi:predicted RNase H-like HicB family nuclease
MAKLSMICTKQNNGTYFAVCPEVKGCFTQGDTYEQAYNNLLDLVKITIHEEMTDDEKEYISQTKSVIFSEFEVAV